MKRFLAALLCAVMCFMLTGCMPLGIPLLADFLEGVAEELEEAANQSSDTDAPLFEMPDVTDADYDPETAEWGDGNPEGSAVCLDGRTVLITLFVDTGDTPWTDADKEVANRFIDMAADYIEEQSAAFGAETELIYSEDGLVYDAFIKGLDVENEEDCRDRNTAINDWIYENINYFEICEAYMADGIAFIVMINDAGISYTLPYYASEHYIDREGFLEKSMIYLRAEDFDGKYEAPAVYAHEILHLFGAVDLYEECEEDGVTEELVRYAKRNYSYDIMYHTYLGSGALSYTDIPQSFSPITAYSLGLVDDIPELKMFPELERQFPCSFWYGDEIES